MAEEARGTRDQPTGGRSQPGPGTATATAVATDREMASQVVDLMRPPLRLVVRDEEEVVALSDGRSYVRRVEVLACGHRQAPPHDRCGEYSAARRRCSSCGALVTAGRPLPQVREARDGREQSLADAACFDAREPVVLLARSTGWTALERRLLTELALALGATKVEPNRRALRPGDLAAAIDALEVVASHKSGLSTDVADAVGPVRQLLDGTWVRFARWYAVHPSPRAPGAPRDQAGREVTLKLLASEGF